jgi:hypothetical protein
MAVQYRWRWYGFEAISGAGLSISMGLARLHGVLTNEHGHATAPILLKMAIDVPMQAIDPQPQDVAHLTNFLSV